MQSHSMCSCNIDSTFYSLLPGPLETEFKGKLIPRAGASEVEMLFNERATKQLKKEIASFITKL